MPSDQASSTPVADATTMPHDAPKEQTKFEREKHIQYLKRSLQMLPQPYTSMDTHRMTFGMFALGGLELLGVLEESVSEANRQAWIEWVYSQQRVPDPQGSAEHDSFYGFAGPFSGMPFQERTASRENIGCECGPNANVYDSSHITMTYAALLVLVHLGDDLSRVAKEPILRSLRKLQQPSGCFIPCITDYEPDLRFMFCAAAISHILNDWSGFDKQAAIRFIQECQTYDHGFSQSRQQESHGGSTYCAVATLGLIGGEALWDQKTMTRNVQDGEDEAAFELRKSRAGFLDKEGTRRWCLQRQTTGFQGRINKKTDTCYSFWIGASLAIIDSYDLVDFDCNRGFLLETQHKVFGGFGKWVDTYPDALHSYMGIASLSFMSEPGILPLDPLLNISKRMQERIYTQTVFWKDSH
ncbi:Geranylgeranyl transferase type-1 subunit beta [Mortierella sp. AD011]|nr:Geranylgeranyl transferase type-1 subunit beta [Mortierella sp. AD010]KAF9396050.1 Geranylgeranyl transferase type-1 subunit beta [Mortierella sp. AD011]